MGEEGRLVGFGGLGGVYTVVSAWVVQHRFHV
jgi:hypothetical protein